MKLITKEQELVVDEISRGRIIEYKTGNIPRRSLQHIAYQMLLSGKSIEEIEEYIHAYKHKAALPKKGFFRLNKINKE